MSKVLSGALCIVLILALLCYFTGTSFNLKAYAENLDNLPDKPTLPTFDDVLSAFDNIRDYDILLAFVDFCKALGPFFKFLFNCIAYPFQWIAYIIEVVLVITNGMIVRG